MNADYAAVAAIAETYARAFHEGDAATLRTLFLPDCRLQFVSEGGLKLFQASDWIDIVQNRPSAASQGHQQRSALRSIQFAGPYCATVMLEMVTPEQLFVDVLHLLRPADGWKIVAKAFHSELI